jgi:hypothetical protein
VSLIPPICEPFYHRGQEELTESTGQEQ